MFLGHECWVSDEALALGVSSGEVLSLVGLGCKLVDSDESLVLLVVHWMVLSEFDDDRVFDAINSVLGVVTGVDLSEGSL